MRGFKASRKYWKLVLCVDNDALRATALVADQSPLIDNVPEALRHEALPKPFPYEKVEHYHHSVAALERLSGFDFGNTIRCADTFPGRRRSGGGEQRPILKIQDVITPPSANQTERTAKPSTRKPSHAKRHA